MVKLWRCEICGDPYIGDAPPAQCPFCGVHVQYIKEAKDAQADFDLKLNERDTMNAERALGVEVSNSAFYKCAAEKTDDPEGKLLFKILGKVEAEHASIWKKVLKLPSVPPGSEQCSTANRENLQNSHSRETRAIDFYRQAAGEAENPRLKEIFVALVEVERDHLDLSAERLK